MKKLSLGLLVSILSFSLYGSGTWPTKEYTLKLKNNSAKQELINPLVLVHKRSFKLDLGLIISFQ